MLRRLGGCFGGKESQNLSTVVATAASAWKTGRPVKISLNKNKELNHTGGRVATANRIEAAFDDEGRFSAYRLSAQLLGGFQPGLAFFFLPILHLARQRTKHIMFQMVSHHQDCILMMLQKEVVVRGPGEIQATVAIENLIELVGCF